MLAESPRYRALYDPASGVVFTRGRAEVTEEQALALAERRYMDGILIDGVPAKKWRKQRDGEEGGEQLSPEHGAPSPSGDVPPPGEITPPATAVRPRPSRKAN